LSIPARLQRVAGAIDRACRRTACPLARSCVRGSGVVRPSRRLRRDGGLSRVAVDGRRRVRTSASPGRQAVSLDATGAHVGTTVGARRLVAKEREERDAPGPVLRRSRAGAAGRLVFAPTTAIQAGG